MNTILTVCCQLALLYAYYSPVQGAIKDSWILSEATVSCSLPEFQAHYNHKVGIFVYDNPGAVGYYLGADANNDDDVDNVLHFDIEEFNSSIGDTIFVVMKVEPRRVVRLKFNDKKQASRLKSAVFAITPDPVAYQLINYYKIMKIVEADESGNKKSEDVIIDQKLPIIIHVYAQIGQNGNRTGKRRLLIHGGEESKMFAVFNRNEFNIVRGTAEDRFALVIKSPAEDFEESVNYGLILDKENNTPEKFAEEMLTYATCDINVPENLKSFADNL